MGKFHAPRAQSHPEFHSPQTCVCVVVRAADAAISGLRLSPSPEFWDLNLGR